MPDRRRLAVVATPLLGLLAAAAAILWPPGTAPAAAQGAEPDVACFEITVGWSLCATSAAAPAEPPRLCSTGAAVPDAANNPGLVADCTALLAAKDALRGTAPLNWDAGKVIRAWDGVTVSGMPPRVTELLLDARALTGTIPASLGDLARLTALDLTANELIGPIPAALGNLARLESLALGWNGLTGAIPEALGNLTRLRALDLRNNRLTGAISPELGNLAQLKRLMLEWNQLTGAIPPALGNLAALENLDLGGNQLSGPIPPALGNLATLQKLDLDGNQLSGPIPPALGNLAALEELVLSLNQLSGSIPAALGNLPALEALVLSLNQLSGPIPPALGNLPALKWLFLGRNQLSGPIPPALGNLPALGWLDLDGNQLSGPIPPALGNLAALEALDLGGNQLSGPIPPALGNLAALEWLDLGGNQLSGPIPPALGNPPHLWAVYLQENRFTGCLPRELADVYHNDFATLGLEGCGLPSVTLSYSAPTTTGSVTDDGDYAFLTDPDDLTTLVTTYEGLRDGSTTGLVIHKNDSAGTSQEALYDLVQSGDILEWRKANDCFVRYAVTEVKDDPADDNGPPRKVLAVAWMTYAFTGCSGAISSTATASLQSGPLPDLGGPSLTAPIRHGLWQIVPEGWTGATEESFILPGDVETFRRAETIGHAHHLPRWRTPDLPSDWVFWQATTGTDSSPFGYAAHWGTGRGSALSIYGERVSGVAYRNEAAVRGTGGELVVAETRMIAGRPAMVYYSPAGPLNARFYGNVVFVHDRETNSQYKLYARTASLRGSNIDALIAIAESLFEPPNEP
ncbi:MAG: hypothetical protein OXI03_07585 [Chloroflexota bacterium]|nr:hypothetical protein [Chloroflexota bacterium]